MSVFLPRNFFAQPKAKHAMATNIFTVECPNCHAPIHKVELKQHMEIQCTKRMVACVNAGNGCEWRGPFDQFAQHKQACAYTEAAQQPKKRKRAEKGTSARAQKMMNEIAKKQQNTPIYDAGVFDANIKSWDPKNSDKNVMFANNHQTTRGSSATGIVVANFSIEPAEETRYWEITFDQEVQPKLFGPYFGFVTTNADVCESMYKQNYCYSCTGTVFVKGQQTMIKKGVTKNDTIGFLIAKQQCTVFINGMSQGVIFEHLPAEVTPAVQPNSSVLTANFTATMPTKY